MSKIAFVFPGQGAQYVGMGEELAKEYPVASEVFNQASEAIGYDMKELCFNSSAEELKLTEKTQPSILTASIAVYKVMLEKGIKPEAVAGLSLGEYSALVASGVLDLSDAVKVVRQRGKYMQEEVPVGVGGMAAILGLDGALVEEACAETEGVVEPANYNCPGQLVIAGELAAVEKASEKCREKGAKKAVMLPVSAPFHTSMLKGAGEKLAVEFEGVSFGPMTYPVVANVTADYVENSDAVKGLLIDQVSSPVKWEMSIRKLVEDGFDTFVEIGPGKALSKFIKKISREVTILNVEDVASLEKTLAKLEA
ncbi:ACP S-malonyltransferase [Acidaminobacter sp. JC074]|uniref:ACP S-malonyltransferase n=1 Tax=Acidaminobacter sp. JC074 TaxID=2530199 RepID=UPI001F0E13BD|nr:ACP S-malonyltransferase [Acidaminobacter sp. JC074]MCH4888343.1 ACP S-malonyltransferase [Acidaminobacter sp. JC074]